MNSRPPAAHFMEPLPIDETIPQVLAALAEGATRLVVEAPPGAGKTTRLPPALLSQSWCQKPIFVTEPRRIAARLSALRVAQERASELGQEVGYRVRFDDRTSQRTRLCYLTEGLLLRMLLDDPSLSRVSAVLLDEVHERSADLDVLFALLLHAQSRNPDLRLIAMSATLNKSELVDYMDGAQVFSSQGRAFPVSIDFAAKAEDRPLPIAVRSAIFSRVKKQGDVLVFLPGEAEILACSAALEQLEGYQVRALHGSLPLEKQAEILRPADSSKRRVILSTNVAESSLTVPGVTSVVDSGLGRVGVFDAWSGISRLETLEISQARAIQRAGRAGRVAPGEAIRLYTRGEFEARPTQDVPEIKRTDLSSVFLLLLLHHERSGLSWQDLKWLSPPDQNKWDKARELLSQLSALDELGRLTAHGRSMAQLPLPPRMARCALAAFQSGIAPLGALAAALLAERDILPDRRRDVIAGDSDLTERMALIEHLEQSHFDRGLARSAGADLRRVRQVVQTQKSNLKALSALLGKPPPMKDSKSPEELLNRALLTGFPDRIAMRKGQGTSLLLCDGVQATLSDQSCVRGATLMLALSVDAPQGRKRLPLVRMAARLDPDFLFDQLPERIEAVEEFLFHPEKQRVDCVSQFRLGKLVLDESRARASPGPEVCELLVSVAKSKGPVVFDTAQRLETLTRKLALLAEHAPSFVATLCPDEKALIESIRQDPAVLTMKALSRAAQTRTSIQELKEADLSAELSDSFSPELARSLREQLPESVRLKGGRIVPVVYEQGKTPYIQSRLQDFFSMTKTPAICFEKLPLSIHFLAPNQRPIQVTTDLAGFWTRHYPELRKQLMRRYPKHLWPEDGATALPPKPGRIR